MPRDAFETSREILTTSAEPRLFTGFPPSGYTACPMCDYDLTGLPAAHRCPECGTAYDGDTLVWTRSLKRHRRMVAGIVVGHAIFVINYSYLTFERWPSVMATITLVFTCIFAFTGISFARLWRRPPIAALMPSGVVYRGRLLRPKLAPWDEIRDVRQSAYRGRPCLFLRRPNFYERRVTGMFESSEDARACLDAIKARIATRDDAASRQ